MKRVDAFARAEQCERLAAAETDPKRQATLRRIRELWLRLALHSDKFEFIDAESEQLNAIETAVKDPRSLH